MLIVLCIVFPPAIPFVILYYLFHGGGQRRRLIQLQARTTVAAERLAGIEPPPAMPWWRWVMVGMIVIASVIGVIVSRVHHGEDTTAPAQADQAKNTVQPHPAAAAPERFVTADDFPTVEQVPVTATVGSGRAIGPSFDCNTEQTPEAQFICASPDLSRTELEFVQAYYALRQQVGPAGWQVLKRENLDSQHRTEVQCGIAPSGALPPDAVALAACLRQGYVAQRSLWLARLSGAAREEASRPVEQHVALQRDLQALGFLPPTATIDGVYGAATRTAISAWQRANNQPDTGFISNTDAGLLTNTDRSTASVAAPTPSATQPSAAFQQGLADRQGWEDWFGSQTGDYLAGAEYWASQRSERHPGPCVRTDGNTAWVAGCREAHGRLAPTDARRLSEPEYRSGWNAFEEPVAVPQAPPLPPRGAPAAAIALPLAGLPAHGENLRMVAARFGRLGLFGWGGGALVCPTVDAGRLALDLMTEDYRQHLIYRALGKVATEMHGPAPTAHFDPASLGCVIVPPGTPLEHNTALPFFHVSGQLPDGQVFSGQAAVGTFVFEAPTAGNAPPGR